MNMKGFGNDIIWTKILLAFLMRIKFFLYRLLMKTNQLRYILKMNIILKKQKKFCVTKKISIEEAIRKVKAAGNDPDEFIDTLLKDEEWIGEVC